jgi:hypothetical protein
MFADLIGLPDLGVAAMQAPIDELHRNNLY